MHRRARRTRPRPRAPDAQPRVGRAGRELARSREAAACRAPRRAGALAFFRDRCCTLAHSMRTFWARRIVGALALGTLLSLTGCAKIKARDFIREGNQLYRDG